MRPSLSIQTPCSERFDDFTPTTHGGFCSNCQKEVIDFTRMTDEELIKYFQHEKGKTCGRLRTDQLSRFKVPASKVNKSPHLYISAFLFALFSGHSLYAQTELTAPRITQRPHGDTPSKQVEVTDSLNRLWGQVKEDSTGHAIPFAQIEAWRGDSLIGFASSDIDGNWEMEGIFYPMDKIKFFYFQEMLVSFSIDELLTHTDQIIYLRINQQPFSVYGITGEVTVAEPYKSKKSLWQKFTSLFY